MLEYMSSSKSWWACFELLVCFSRFYSLHLWEE